LAETSEIPAWIALFLGLYLLAAGAGELRAPNGWWMMLKEFERSPALRFVTGVISLALGATVYLVTPWRTDDWLSIAVSVIGGLHVAQGLLILASGERFLHAARAVLGRSGRLWGGVAALAGIALTLVAMMRLEPL
jgi:hypothetical protein